MAKAKRADDTRTRVLDAALAVYERVGREGFGVHAIVATSGVSLGSIYHHFGSMDGLCAALYARSMAALLDEIVAALQSVRSLSRGVTVIVEAYLGFARHERPAMSFIHASAYASFLPAHAALIAESKSAQLASVVAFFAKHVEAGRVVALPVALLEIMVIGPVAELTRRWLADSNTIDLELAQRLLPARIVASIATT
jgi:AcrR family transcriptional regulator